MKKYSLIKPFIACAIGVAIICFSCSKSGGKDDNTTHQPDSTLIDLANNIIIPSYQQLSTTTATFDSKVTVFVANPTTATLSDLRNAFKDAYKSWEACSEFEFGPAADASLTTHFTNAFPADTAIIINNINGSTYAIDGIGNFAAQGFPAFDYLLYGYGTNGVLARFTTDAHAAGARAYLAALSASLKTKAAKVLNTWSLSGDKYVNKFITATGVDAGSSLSLLVNAYVRDFDITLQNFKIGIPIGLYGPNILPKSPTKVEAYYSGLSVQLLQAQMDAYKNIYSGGSGKGLSYKVAATHAQKNGGTLDDAIRNQINVLIAKIQALPDPLSTGVENNSSAINDAYTEVRKLTVLLKVDMCSALGVRISFQDDDGD
jgi:predicted lipoprotein